MNMPLLALVLVLLKSLSGQKITSDNFESAFRKLEEREKLVYPPNTPVNERINYRNRYRANILAYIRAVSDFRRTRTTGIVPRETEEVLRET